MKPRSASERLIWRWIQHSPKDPRLVLRYGFEVQGSLDVPRLEHALRVLVERHYPNLKARFVEIEGCLYKSYAAPAEHLLYHQELTANAAEPENWCLVDHHDGPLYRLTVSAFNGNSTLWIAISHLVIDGATYPHLCHLLETLTESRNPANIECLRKCPDAACPPASAEAQAFWQ